MKTLKRFMIGTILSILPTGIWAILIMGFITVTHETGYSAVLMFIGLVLILSMQVFLSWAIGYAVDTMKPINEKNENDDFCGHGTRK